MNEKIAESTNIDEFAARIPLDEEKVMNLLGEQTTEYLITLKSKIEKLHGKTIVLKIGFEVCNEEIRGHVFRLTEERDTELEALIQNIGAYERTSYAYMGSHIEIDLTLHLKRLKLFNFFLNVYWNGIYKKVCMLATIAITVGIKIMYDFLINALRCDE